MAVFEAILPDAIGENKVDYFNRLVDITNTKEAIEAVWRHMMTIDLTGFNPRQIPETTIKAEMMLDGGHAVFQFMQDFLTRDGTSGQPDGRQFSTDDMHEEFFQWKERTKDRRNLPTKRNLVKLLKDELGMSSKVLNFMGTNKRGYKINFDQIHAKMKSLGMWDDSI